MMKGRGRYDMIMRIVPEAKPKDQTIPHCQPHNTQLSPWLYFYLVKSSKKPKSRYYPPVT